LDDAARVVRELTDQPRRAGRFHAKRRISSADTGGFLSVARGRPLKPAAKHFYQSSSCAVISGARCRPTRAA